MLFRLLFPYIFLMVIVLGYLYSRHIKLGPVILKVQRTLYTRYNTDSLFLVLIIAAVSYYLARYEIQNALPTDDMLILGSFTYVLFYGVLVLVVILREVESPAFREKGISSSRGFWMWSEIDSFRWSKNVLTLNMARGKRKRTETWQIKPLAKKEIDQVLKSKVAKRTNRPKKKS